MPMNLPILGDGYERFKKTATTKATTATAKTATKTAAKASWQKVNSKKFRKQGNALFS